MEPLAGIVETVAERRADLVAVSATISKHTRSVEALVKALRGSDTTRAVPVMVGGYPFNLEPELWRRLGARTRRNRRIAGDLRGLDDMQHAQHAWQVSDELAEELAAVKPPKNRHPQYQFP